jgi:hypothetical protein
MYYQFLQERSREVERAREAATRTARGFEGMTVVAGFYIQRYSPTLVRHGQLLSSDENYW